MKLGIIVCTAFLLAGLAFSETVETDSGNTIETITSLDQIEWIVRNTQWDFWQLVPPSTDDPFYLHSERSIRVVDWNSKDWPKPLLKQMYGEMISVGAYGLEYPFYRLTVIEDRSGDMVYFNAYDEEVWRTPAPKGGENATGFLGSKGFELKNAPYQPVRNTPGSVAGRDYSGHAFDQMQNRGVMPSVIENTIQTGKSVPGKMPGTTAHYDAVNDLTVITDAQSGRVITVGRGEIRQ